MMMGSWMGSDLTNDDVVRASSWEDDYTAAFTDEGAAADEWCIVYTPKPSAAVTWSKVVACVERATLLPRRQVFYDEKDRKARTMSFREVKEMGGRTIPSVMVVEPHLKGGHKTTIRYDAIDFDAELPANTFSLPYRFRNSAYSALLISYLYILKSLSSTLCTGCSSSLPSLGAL